MTETPFPYGTTPQSDFTSQYRRVLEVAECRTQVELAALLDIRQSAISDARRRNIVPSDWLVKLFERRRINPDWIRCGTGARFLFPAAPEQSMPHVVRVTEVRPPQECSAQDLFNELVRRAMPPLDIEAVQKQVADTWIPVDKKDGE